MGVKITQLPQGSPQLTDQLAGVDTTGTPTTKKFLFGDQVSFIGTEVQNQTFTFGVTGGTSTAYTVSFVPAVTALQDGQLFLVQFTVANGASPTININTLGPIPLVDANFTALAANAIPAANSLALVAICNNETQAMVTSQYISVPVSGSQGGTGVANTGKTITLGGNLTTSGAFASTFTMTNTTGVTFPTTGTLSTLTDRGYVLISTAAASNSTTIDFTTLTGYTNYVVFISSLVPATDNVIFYLRVSTDGGSTYAASSGNYWQQILTATSSTVAAAEVVTNTYIDCGSTINNVSTLPLGGIIEILNPAGGFRTNILGKVFFQGDSGSQRLSFGGAQFQSNSTVNAIRFLMSSGNISTGSFQLYGVK